MLKKLQQGEILTLSHVENTSQAQNRSQQKLIFRHLGMHQKNCRQVMARLGRYENYQDYLDFIKKSTYEESTQILFFTFDSPLMPFPLSLTFQLPRIQGPGVYPFLFTKGIFPNLKGTINVVDHKERCLFFLKAEWQGPHTGIPNLIIEVFSQTLAQKGTEKLFRISTF